MERLNQFKTSFHPDIIDREDQKVSGVFFLPAKKRKKPGLVISVGIHGNESAPVELLSHQLAALSKNDRDQDRDFLLIFGNLEAMDQQVRYQEKNLNRLFKDNLRAELAEEKRAHDLMEAVTKFVDQQGELGFYHFDLHTAIRESCEKRFCVLPANEIRGEMVADHFFETSLSQMELTATLHMPEQATTFSSWTFHRGAIASATVELGRVAAYGQNELSEFNGVANWLKAVLIGQEPSASTVSTKHYRVIHQLRKKTENFQFLFEEDLPNFTAFKKDQLIAKDGRDIYSIECDGDTVIFPLASVPLGGRAALICRPDIP